METNKVVAESINTVSNNNNINNMKKLNLLFIEGNRQNIDIWGIERSGFFNGREKWAKGFENQRV